MLHFSLTTKILRRYTNQGFQFPVNRNPTQTSVSQSFVKNVLPHLPGKYNGVSFQDKLTKQLQ